jgi:ATP adenylyltransferase
MKIMSAGWRMAYVSKGSCKDCILCRMARSKDDRKNLVVFRGDLAFVVMNRYPYATGHLMVAPYRHAADLADLTPDEACGIMALVRLCESLLAEALHPQGLNVGINIGRCAGAGCPGHVHVHVVPRWEGDANFMPVVSETKVLPETLTDTYRRIIRAGRALDWQVPAGRKGAACSVGPSPRARSRSCAWKLGATGRKKRRKS